MQVVLDQFEAFVGVNFFTMIFAWINLIILYVFLKKLLFNPVKNMIDSRQKEIDDMYSDAEANRTDAEAMKTEYESKLAAADAESEQILKTAIRRAQLREEEILKDADLKAARTLERAEEQIEKEKRQAINDVKSEISSIALDIAAAVIERDVDAKDHAALIDEFIDKIGE
ncbi:MAG: F0F1 ATP synthase subunit B [Ruminococcaceae bacterium]|nr:F0F1 ATP synthase subunit B [Oscillospiraceae bacterium]